MSGKWHYLTQLPSGLRRPRGLGLMPGLGLSPKPKSGGTTPTYLPSLDFSEARNSQYTSLAL